MQVLTYEIMFEFSFDSGHLLPLIFYTTSALDEDPHTSLGTAISIFENLHGPLKSRSLTLAFSYSCGTNGNEKSMLWDKEVWSLVFSCCAVLYQEESLISMSFCETLTLCAPCPLSDPGQVWITSGTVRAKVLLSAREKGSKWLACRCCLSSTKQI